MAVYVSKELYNFSVHVSTHFILLKTSRFQPHELSFRAFDPWMDFVNLLTCSPQVECTTYSATVAYFPCR